MRHQLADHAPRSLLPAGEPAEPNGALSPRPADALLADAVGWAEDGTPLHVRVLVDGATIDGTLAPSSAMAAQVDASRRLLIQSTPPPAGMSGEQWHTLCDRFAHMARDREQHRARLRDDLLDEVRRHTRPQEAGPDTMPAALWRRYAESEAHMALTLVDARVTTPGGVTVRVAALRVPADQVSAWWVRG